MIELCLHNPGIRIGDHIDGGKALIFVDEQSGIHITTRLDDEGAEKLAEALAGSGIEIARNLDPRIFPGEDGHS